MISTWGHHHHHHQHPETILDDVSGSGELFREDAVQGGCCPGRMLLLTQPCGLRHQSQKAHTPAAGCAACACGGHSTRTSEAAELVGCDGRGNGAEQREGAVVSGMGPTSSL